MAYQNIWKLTKAAREKGEEYIALLGQDGHCCIGHLHDVTVSSRIYFQQYAGGKNYHTCTEFDAALSDVIRDEFEFLKVKALGRMREIERKALCACRQEVEAVLDEIKIAEDSACGS